jgi:hypothetical protein
VRAFSLLDGSYKGEVPFDIPFSNGVSFTYYYDTKILYSYNYYLKKVSTT